MNITIIIATTDCKILNNSSFLSMDFKENFRAIVVNQKINSSENLVLNNPIIKVINSTEKGISNSRNLALSHAHSDYVHFCDDDVEFLPNYLMTIDEALKQYPNADFFQFQILRENNVPYKKYRLESEEIKGNSIASRRKVLGISSVEIVGKLSVIKGKQLKFDPIYGIGGKEYSIGEEVIFLLDALKKDCSIRYIPKPLVVHNEAGSGQQIKASHLNALGKIFNEVYGRFTPIFYLYYAIKKQGDLKKQGLSIWETFLKLQNKN